MGHIEYYLQYQNQPNPFRRGANPGFHEAIGDSITLSVSTPKHLHRVGLLAEETNDPKSIINLQLELGMQKLAFLPFAYTMDKIRYDVFRGNIQPENANCHFGVFEKSMVALDQQRREVIVILTLQQSTTSALTSST